MKQVILDVETTGLEDKSNRILEIAAVEIINRKRTGRILHQYFNPQCDITAEATKIHGITLEQVSDKPTFAELASEVMQFLEGAELIAHNMSFDSWFLNHEFSMLNNDLYADFKNKFILTDSLEIARKLYPGKKNSLDALCSRLNIDNSKRILHSALIDAELLVDIYLKMTTEQISIDLIVNKPIFSKIDINKSFELISIEASKKEVEEHEQFLQKIRREL